MLLLLQTAAAAAWAAQAQIPGGRGLPRGPPAPPGPPRARQQLRRTAVLSDAACFFTPDREHGPNLYMTNAHSFFLFLLSFLARTSLTSQVWVPVLQRRRGQSRP